MFQREDQFRDIEACSFFAEPRFSLEMPEKLATALEVGHEVQIGVRLERKLEAD